MNLVFFFGGGLPVGARAENVGERGEVNCNECTDVCGCDACVRAYDLRPWQINTWFINARKRRRISSSNGGTEQSPAASCNASGAGGDVDGDSEPVK